jgi:hypothetical protein
MSACARGNAPPDDLQVEWSLSPTSPTVSVESKIQLSIRDAAGQPATGATVRIEAHMTHPGMAPVIETGVGDGKGQYVATLRFSMSGSWVLFLRGELSDRRMIDRRLGDVTVRPEG